MSGFFYCGGQVSYERRFPPRLCGDCHVARAPVQWAAILAVRKAVREGRLPHPKTLGCTDCSAPAFEYDHRDYDQPLSVEPVCRRHNILRGPAAWKQAA